MLSKTPNKKSHEKFENKILKIHKFIRKIQKESMNKNQK